MVGGEGKETIRVVLGHFLFSFAIKINVHAEGIATCVYIKK